MTDAADEPYTVKSDAGKAPCAKCGTLFLRSRSEGALCPACMKSTRWRRSLPRSVSPMNA